MNKEKKKLYLSELFLETLNGDFSLEAVLKALKRCDEEILHKLDGCGFVNRLFKAFRRMLGLKKEIHPNMQQGLLDFWDVYGEFDNMLSPGMKKKYFVLRMI